MDLKLKIVADCGEGLSLGTTLDITGRGTLDHPFVIKPVSDKKQKDISLSLSESSNYIELKNFKYESLRLYSCINITLFNLNCRIVRAIDCTNIIIKESYMKNSITLED